MSYLNTSLRRIMLTVGLCLTFPAFADLDYEETYQRLKTVPEDYRNFGTICERVGWLELYEVYDSEDYEIIVGIEYSNGHRILGELDLVVLQRWDGEAVLVSEVKCSNSPGSAVRKAREQLARFNSVIASGQKVYIYHKANRDRHFLPTQFDEQPLSYSMGQKGSTHHGFDLEISFSLEQVRDIRDRLIFCQHRGECPTHP